MGLKFAKVRNQLYTLGEMLEREQLDPFGDVVKWEDTSHEGVSICTHWEEKGSLSGTWMAVKIEPGYSIEPHNHPEGGSEREEELKFIRGGHFEITIGDNSQVISSDKEIIVKIKGEEWFGVTNLDQVNPLFILASIHPAFTGFGKRREERNELLFDDRLAS